MDSDEDGVALEAAELFGVEVGLGLLLELELDSELPTGTTFPPCTLPAELELEVPAAFDLYVARELPDAGGLITPAMPPWQCVGVTQKNHIGSVFWTVTWKTSALVMDPESNPELEPWQGVLKSPWTAV